MHVHVLGCESCTLDETSGRATRVAACALPLVHDRSVRASPRVLPNTIAAYSSAPSGLSSLSSRNYFQVIYGFSLNAANEPVLLTLGQFPRSTASTAYSLVTTPPNNVACPPLKTGTTSLPTQIGLLTTLKHIVLSNINMTGTIPTEILLLTNLRTLVLVCVASSFAGGSMRNRSRVLSSVWKSLDRENTSSAINAYASGFQP